MLESSAPPPVTTASVEYVSRGTGGSASSAPTAVEIIGKTLLTFACSLIASLGAGVGAGILGFLAVAANDDPGSWDGLGSIMFGVLVFLGVGVLAYIVATIVCLLRFVPDGYRTLPTLFLTWPFWLGPLAMLVGSL